MLTSRHADQFFGMPPCDLAAHPEATATLQVGSRAHAPLVPLPIQPERL